jgi:hypothetical protein
MMTVDRTKTVADYGFAFKKSEDSAIKVTAGAFKLLNGDIYIVKPNHEHTRLYAKKLVISSQRVTELGEHVEFDFQYEPGAIFNLLPKHRMSEEEAKALMIRYGRCIMCGRLLKKAESVERGMGRTCWKHFRGEV